MAPRIVIKNRSEYSTEFRVAVCKYAHENPHISTVRIAKERNCSQSIISKWYAQYLIENKLESTRSVSSTSSSGRVSYSPQYKQAIIDAWMLEEKYGSKTITTFAHTFGMSHVTLIIWIKNHKAKLEILQKLNITEDALRQLLA